MLERRLFKTLCIFIALFAVCVISGCTKTGREADLSETDSLASSHEWCVITVPYAAFKNEPSEQAEVIEHGRRSDIYEVTGKKYVTENKQTMVWYQFEKGWLPESSVLIYQNRLKAQTAAASMNE